MNDIERIGKMLKRRPFLMCDAETGTVELISESAAMKQVFDWNHPRLLVNLRGAFNQFGTLEGVDCNRSYRRAAVAKVAGVSKEAVWTWIRDNALLPSIRESGRGRGLGPLYSWTDLFCAAVIGMARRQGMPLSVLRQIQPMFAPPTHQKNKTEKRPTTAVRS